MKTKALWVGMATWLILGGFGFSEAAPFTDNGLTVTDTFNGLVWQKQDDGAPRTWEQALRYCEGLSLDFETDWRLANITELQSIVNYNLQGPAIDRVFGSVGTTYFSSTTNVDSASFAWYVNFSNGSVLYSLKTDTHHARCVRGGQ